MKSAPLFILILLFNIFNIHSQNNTLVLSEEKHISVEAINHATMVLKLGDKLIYTDPYSDELLKGDRAKADVILITDIHRDHYSVDHINKVIGENTRIIVPQAVYDLMPDELKLKSNVLNNGVVADFSDFDFSVEAVPMYNLDPAKKDFHVKGRGNGYLIDLHGFRIYISGDTEDIPEMRSLEAIKVAFVCMNEPYTMNVSKAADAVSEFKPSLVIPYHYRNADKSLSDVETFCEKVKESGVECTLLDWY